jgi:hypothetical protein
LDFDLGIALSLQHVHPSSGIVDAIAHPARLASDCTFWTTPSSDERNREKHRMKRRVANERTGTVGQCAERVPIQE